MSNSIPTRSILYDFESLDGRHLPQIEFRWMEASSTVISRGAKRFRNGRFWKWFYCTKPELKS